MTPHAIISSTEREVTCRCGWTGPREGHELHRRKETAAAGITAARAALEQAEGGI